METDKPFGGHIRNPREDCPKKEFFFQAGQSVWLDINICHKCPNIKTCQDRKDHLTKGRKKK
jgi:hypothetical protein